VLPFANLRFHKVAPEPKQLPTPGLVRYAHKQMDVGLHVKPPLRTFDPNFKWLYMFAKFSSVSNFMKIRPAILDVHGRAKALRK
jgi:hypothetical protein